MAVADLTLQARLAAAAGPVRDRNVVAFLEACHLAADLLDNAAALVAEHARQWHRKVLVAADEVRVADAHPGDTHQHLVVLRIGEIQFGDLK